MGIQLNNIISTINHLNRTGEILSCQSYFCLESPAGAGSPSDWWSDSTSPVYLTSASVEFMAMAMARAEPIRTAVFRARVRAV